jgi:hypothetical protein
MIRNLFHQTLYKLQKRILIIGVVTSLVQIVLFIFLHDFIIFLSRKYFQIELRSDVNWGITLEYTVLFYSAIVVIINLIAAFTNLHTKSIFICLLLLLLFDCSLFPLLNDRPYRTSLLLLLSNGLFLLTFLVHKYLSRRTSATHNIS